MSTIPPDFDPASLSVNDRLALIEKIWDSLAEPDIPDLPDWHREILDARLQMEVSAESGVAWDELYQRLLKK